MKVFTTGQVACMLGISVRTVVKWCDAGRFDGFYRVPCSQDRRIPQDGLLAFLRLHKMPIPSELAVSHSLVLVHGTDECAKALSHHLGGETVAVLTVFDLGRLIGEARQWTGAVLDLTRVDSTSRADVLSGMRTFLPDNVPIVVLYAEDVLAPVVIGRTTPLAMPASTDAIAQALQWLLDQPLRELTEVEKRRKEAKSAAGRKAAAARWARNQGTST